MLATDAADDQGPYCVAGTARSGRRYVLRQDFGRLVVLCPDAGDIGVGLVLSSVCADFQRQCDDLRERNAAMQQALDRMHLPRGKKRRVSAAAPRSRAPRSWVCLWGLLGGVLERRSTEGVALGQTYPTHERLLRELDQTDP